MAEIYHTKEYLKRRNNLLVCGSKVGKEAYDKALVAESEARQGGVLTVPRTNEGENRIPHAEKYDLPGYHRLVVQRVKQVEGARAFLFVGSHDETERWLDNNRDYLFPLPRTDADERKRREKEKSLSRELEELKNENETLNSLLGEQDEESRKREAQLKESKDRQKDLESAKDKQAAALADAQRRLEEAQKAKDSAAQGILEEINVTRAKHEAAQQRLAEHQRHAAEFRRQFMAAQQDAAREKARSQQEIRSRSEKIHELTAQMARMQRENEELRNRQAAAPPPPPRPWGLLLNWPRLSRLFVLIGCVLLLFLALAAVAAYMRSRGWTTSTPNPTVPPVVPNPDVPRDKGNPGGKPLPDSDHKPPPPNPEKEKGEPKPPDPKPNVPKPDPPEWISPDEAAREIGKYCKVEMVVRSTFFSKDRKTVFLNSQTDSDVAGNLKVVIFDAVRQEIQANVGVDDLAAYFRGKKIRVAGEVGEWPPQKGRPEIVVKSSKQIELVNEKK